MKNSLIFMTLALLFACSCKKSNPEPDAPNDIENNMLKVVRNGALLQADFVSGVFIDSTSTLTIMAFFDEQATVSMGMTIPRTVGTYTFVDPDSGIPTAFFMEQSNEDNTFISISGTLVISSYNAATKRIKGTFNFVGQSLHSENTINLTDGMFDFVHF